MQIKPNLSISKSFLRPGEICCPIQWPASVLSQMGSTQATELWEEGSWSDFRGIPSAVVLHEGRLRCSANMAILADLGRHGRTES